MLLSILVLYLFALLIIGILSYSGYKTESYFFSNYNIKSKGLFFSLVASIIGGSSTVGLIGLASKVGLPASWWLLSGSVGLFILYFISDKLFLLKINTISDVFRIFYSDKVEKLSSLLIAIAWTGIIAGQIIAASKLFNLFLNYDNLNILNAIFLAVVIFYVFLGGQKAVIRTDKVQFFILLPALILLLILLIFKVNFDEINTDFFVFPYNKYFSSLDVASLFLVIFPMYLVGPDIYSRILSTKDKKIAKNSILITAFSLIGFAILISFIGILGKKLVGIQGEQLVFKLILHGFPKVFEIIILLGFLSAFLSSADTCFLTATSLISLNLFKGNKKKNKNLIVIITYAVFVFFIMLKFQTILKALLFGYKIFVAGLFFPFIMPLIWKENKFYEWTVYTTMLWALLINIYGLFYKIPYSGIVIFFGSFLVFTLSNFLYKKIKTGN